LRSKQQFWGVNSHFPAKHAKHSNYYIIETTSLIATKFCTVLENTFWYAPNKSKMADGRHLEQSKNRNVSQAGDRL